MKFKARSLFLEQWKKEKELKAAEKLKKMAATHRQALDSVEAGIYDKETLRFLRARLPGGVFHKKWDEIKLMPSHHNKLKWERALLPADIPRNLPVKSRKFKRPPCPIASRGGPFLSQPKLAGPGEIIKYKRGELQPTLIVGRSDHPFWPVGVEWPGEDKGGEE